MQAFTDQSEESDALRGLGAYLNISSRISCCSATAATTLISLPYTPTFHRVHSRSSSYSHHTSVSIVPSIINSPYTPPTSNRRLLPIGTDSGSMSRPSRPPEPNPALKGLGLHPDALTQKPSLQAGSAEDERRRRKQAKEHSRAHAFPERLALVDASSPAPAPSPTVLAAPDHSDDRARREAPTHSGNVSRPGPSGASNRKLAAVAQTTSASAKKRNIAVKCTETPLSWGSPLAPDAMARMRDAEPRSTEVVASSTTAGRESSWRREQVKRNQAEVEKLKQMTEKLGDWCETMQKRDYTRPGTLRDRYNQVCGLDLANSGRNA